MKRSKLFAWTGTALVSLLLTGCNLVSDPALMKQTLITRQLDPQGLSRIDASLAIMRSTHTYLLKATQTYTEGSNVKTADYFGTISLPSTIMLSETIDGLNAVIYQSGKHAYVNMNGKWQSAPPVTNVLPWDALAALLTLHPPRQVYDLPTQPVLSWECDVYQFQETIPQSWRGVVPASEWPLMPRDALYTLWIDKGDHHLRQMEIQSTSGVPSLGTVTMNAVQTYANLNLPVTITMPAGLKKTLEN